MTHFYRNPSSISARNAPSAAALFPHLGRQYIHKGPPKRETNVLSAVQLVSLPKEERKGGKTAIGPGQASALLSSSEPRSFFFGVMGTPFQSELTTSLFRMIQSALTQGHQVTVWTCGYATNLTQHSLVRPPDSFADKEGVQQNNLTTAQVAQALISQHRENLNWYVCRYCMEERGATQQIDEVHVKIPFTFQHYLSAADVSVVLGVK